jgi:hypothetical protein
MNLKKWKETGALELNQEDINDPDTMLVVENQLNKQQDAWVKEIEAIQNFYKISNSVAADIWYLRTRSRWTKEKELELSRKAQEK